MLESKETLLLDQEHIETVIPSIGGKVLIVNGEHRGNEGILENLNVDSFTGTIKLKNGDSFDILYEHFCKIQT